jgi:hypothetical protein
MKNLIKKIIYDTAIWNWYIARKNERLYEEWIQAGKPAPPPQTVKHRAILEYQERFGLTRFIETGTLHGDTTKAVEHAFEQVDTIELGEELAANAKKRFVRKPKITVHQGDSGVEIKKVLDRLDQPALFFLDAHYSKGETARGEKDTPITNELQSILNHSIKEHVILIDDARDFSGENDYPTIPELERSIKERDPNYEFEVTDDIIRIYLP